MSVIENNCTSTLWMWRNATGQATALTGAGGILFERCNKVNDTAQAVGLPATSVSAGSCGSCNASAECYAPLTRTNAGCATNKATSSIVCQCKSAGGGGRCVPVNSITEDVPAHTKNLTPSLSSSLSESSRETLTGSSSASYSGTLSSTASATVNSLRIASASDSSLSQRSAWSTLSTTAVTPSPTESTTCSNGLLLSETIITAVLSHSFVIIGTEGGANSNVSKPANGSISQLHVVNGGTAPMLVLLTAADGLVEVVFEPNTAYSFSIAQNGTSSIGTVVQAAIVAGGRIVVTLNVAQLDVTKMSASRTVLFSVSVDTLATGPCLPPRFPMVLTFSCNFSPLMAKSALRTAVAVTFQTSTTVSSALGNPVSALSNVAMMSILGLDECIFSDVDPLDPSVSPLGVGVGNELGQYYRGAVVAALGMYAHS